jgi:hypothetical protein
MGCLVLVPSPWAPWLSRSRSHHAACLLLSLVLSLVKLQAKKWKKGKKGQSATPPTDVNDTDVDSVATAKSAKKVKGQVYHFNLKLKFSPISRRTCRRSS